LGLLEKELQDGRAVKDQYDRFMMATVHLDVMNEYLISLPHPLENVTVNTAVSK
jgi:hypothetical protein